MVNLKPLSFRQIIAIFYCAIFLTLFGMYFQLRGLGNVYREKTFEESYYYFLEEGYQYEGHINVINGTADSPWRYRLFAEYTAETLIVLLDKLNAPHPIANGFILLRFIQGIVVFVLAGIYYRYLNLDFYFILLGILLLAWGVSYAQYNSDLSPNTYFDLILYLLVMVLLFKRVEIWIIPLMVIAALNRETAALIPIIVASACYWRDMTARSNRKFSFSKREFLLIIEDAKSCKRLLIVAGSSFIVFWTVFALLRIMIPPQPFAVPYGIAPGLPLLIFNLTSVDTWMSLLATLSIIPVMALVLYAYWPLSTKFLFWIIVPVWMGVHLMLGIFAETRLFLVPQTLVFIPGFLFGLQSKIIEAAGGES